jgi:hypothetical protein
VIRPVEGQCIDIDNDFDFVGQESVRDGRDVVAVGVFDGLDEVTERLGVDDHVKDIRGHVCVDVVVAVVVGGAPLSDGCCVNGLSDTTTEYVLVVMFRVLLSSSVCVSDFVGVSDAVIDWLVVSDGGRVSEKDTECVNERVGNSVPDALFDRECDSVSEWVLIGGIVIVVTVDEADADVVVDVDSDTDESCDIDIDADAVNERKTVTLEDLRNVVDVDMESVLVTEPLNESETEYV